MKIYTPVINATGVWCNVRFVNGVGETDIPHLVEWFKSHGYKIEEIDENQTYCLKLSGNKETSQNIEVKTENPISDDFDNMTPNQLRDWAKANGLGGKIKNIRNKEKLIEIIRG